jgi:hypothetical protein
MGAFPLAGGQSPAINLSLWKCEINRRIERVVGQFDAVAASLPRQMAA